MSIRPSYHLKYARRILKQSIEPLPTFALEENDDVVMVNSNQSLRELREQRYNANLFSALMIPVFLMLYIARHISQKRAANGIAIMDGELFDED